MDVSSVSVPGDSWHSGHQSLARRCEAPSQMIIAIVFHCGSWDRLRSLRHPSITSAGHLTLTLVATRVQGCTGWYAVSTRRGRQNGFPQLHAVARERYFLSEITALAITRSVRRKSSSASKRATVSWSDASLVDTSRRASPSSRVASAVRFTRSASARTDFAAVGA